MSRFSSLFYAPSETRRFLRERFDRNLRIYSQARYLDPDVQVVPDQMVLRVLQGIDVAFEADWDRAETAYSAANPSSAEPKNLRALVDDGWVRIVWGRVKIARDLRVDASQAQVSPMTAFQALLNRIHAKTYRWTQAVPSEVDAADLVTSIETGQRDIGTIICQTPAWVAARLWETRLGQSNDDATDLRHWVDLWHLLHAPALVPGDQWRPFDAKSFRAAAISVITSEPSFSDWSETRSVYVHQLALVSFVSITDAELRIPKVPATLVDRALWFESPMIEHYAHSTLDSYGDVFGLLRLLLADVVAEDNASAPHPMAVQLLDLAIGRAELFFDLLFQVRAHPKLLADLLLYPPTTTLACLLVAQWRSPTSAWDRNLAEQSDRIAKVEVFTDAVGILGTYLHDAKAEPTEVAALLNWFHNTAGPGFIGDVINNDVLLEILRRELACVEKSVLLEIAKSFYGPGLKRGLGTSEFAALLDLVDLGDLSADMEPATVIDAYAKSIQAGEYGLEAHRVGISGATALAQLATRSPELRQKFLYPLQIRERLAAATADENPYTLASSIGQSIRAHIRILCRALAGSRDEVSGDLLDALVEAVRSGALAHKEKNRVAAFAPRFEQNLAGPTRDRPLAMDLSAALGAVSDLQRTSLLNAILETDEPSILAQLLSCSPPVLRVLIEQRITALIPSESGDIYSLIELQARINELLTAGAADAAARYIEVEAGLKPNVQIPGREVTRYRNQLRLHYVREEWSAIVGTLNPNFQSPVDQASAMETLHLFQGIAAIKGSTPNPEGAKIIFADLFERRPAVAYAINWFAAEISRLLHADSFGLLKGTDVRDGHHALAELKRMIAIAPATATSDDEMTECNRALLLLALGEPSQALAVVASAPLVQLQDVAAAYRAVALVRLGQANEAIAALDTAEHIYGVTSILAAARAHIASNTGFHSVPDVSSDDGRFRDVTLAIAQFRTMNPLDQARVLGQPNSFEGLVVDYVRAAADSVMSLVPMMKGVQIDTIEDDLTAFIQQLLAGRVHFHGWSLADQSKGGFTAKGNPGERDLLLMSGNTVLAAIEAVVCDQPLSHDSMCADLESHFQKLLGYANTRLFFHLTYAYIEDKAALMTFLEGIAKTSSPLGFTFIGHDPIPHTDSRPPGFVARYDGEFGEVKVVFLVLNLGQQRQRQAAKLAAVTKTRRAPKAKKI